MKKPKLIPGWKKAWKLFSVQSMTFAAALQGAWTAIPANLVANVPSWLVHVVTIGILGFGIAGRLIDQTKENQE